LREPLTHFVIAGGVLFAVAGRSESAADNEIVVTPELVEALASQRSDLLGRPLTAEERGRVVDEYVDAEVLVREAYRLGLDRTDTRVRQQLINNMRFIMTRDPPPPTEDDLRRFLADNEERYRPREVRTIEHVYLAPDSDTRPSEALTALTRGSDWTALGEAFWLGKRLEGYTRPRLSQALGQAFAEAAFAAETDLWIGPIVSPFGSHILRVASVEALKRPSFDQLRARLMTDWYEVERLEDQERQVSELRARYRIQLPADGRP
jgi:hypothetical protein